MSFEALRKHAASLRGATTDVKWGADWQLQKEFMS